MKNKKVWTSCTRIGDAIFKEFCEKFPDSVQKEIQQYNDVTMYCIGISTEFIEVVLTVQKQIHRKRTLCIPGQHHC